MNLVLLDYPIVTLFIDQLSSLPSGLLCIFASVFCFCVVLYHLVRVKLDLGLGGGGIYDSLRNTGG